MHLTQDLYTIYGELLVKKDQEITPIIVKSVRTMGERHKDVRVPLENTDIFTDFEKVFNDKRYITMFKPPISKNEICNVASKLKMENDLIFELNTMKNNLPYTYLHLLIIAAFAIKLGLLYDSKKYNREIVSHCGFTHDIGKTRIPISILNKEKKLTKEERFIIETHPITGYLLLNYYLKRDRRDCSLASLDHHERLDGSGYPKGIKRINRYTQLISPIDVLDALMTKRPYRKQAYSLRASLDYLLKEADSHRLSKNIVLTLVSLARKEKPDIRTMKISRKLRERLPEELTYEKYL
ncbi:MAG: HD domain-containing protein [Candidatus Omnitrophica bacterium]|nr:HD domain-containing protein [Candidatus Omnitrophota bacterium]